MPRLFAAAWRSLRSRRLAVYLIVGITAYAFAVTLVPIGPPGDADVARWAREHPRAEAVVGALGMHRPYSRPWFLAAAALLTLSTIACASERTSQALRSSPRLGVVPERALERLRDRPSVRLAAPHDLPAEEVVTAVAGALRAVGLKVAAGPRLVDAEGNRLGLIGSPLFHWALAGLFLFAGLGQLTRAEGVLDVPLGSSLADTHASYTVRPSEGPLFLERHTGLEFHAEDLDRDYVADGVARGPAAVVTLSDGGRVLRRQRVYPNNPLRYGSLLVHQNDVGLVFLGSLLPPEADAEPAPVRLTFPGTKDAGDERVAEGALTLASGRFRIRIEALPDVKAAVSWRAEEGTATGKRTVIAQGESVVFPGGARLRADRLTSYVRLTVQNDWSVPFLYALFSLASLAAVVALFLPPRRVRVLYVRTAEGPAVHVDVRGRRSDPAFPLRVRRALDDALRPPDEED